MHRLRFLIALLIPVFTILAYSQTIDLRQHLHDRYQGKAFLLRGFYSGDRLLYNSSGELSKGATSGDWTVDGFVLVEDVHPSGKRIIVKARRLLVIVSDREFHLRAAEQKGSTETTREPVFVEIEADMGVHDPSPEQVEAAFSKIFLTAQDQLFDWVPDYWKVCVSQGLLGKNENCRFSTEILAVAGVAPVMDNAPGDALSASTVASPPAGKDVKLTDSPPQQAFHVGRGVKPPRLVEHHEPEFSDAARAVKYQGTMTLGLIVDKEGVPGKVHILSPLGSGLDVKAVQAVEAWRFQPAEKDGEPVAVEIAVEVDFHLD